MWPWEHLALGYLLYSLGGRALDRGPPADGGVAALAVGTQAPDLVDKPLSWGLGWFPTGFAVGHSVFVAVPACLAVLWAARRRGRPDLGGGFVVGVLSHLGGDLLSPLRSGGTVAVGRLLWPVSTQAPYESDRGLRRGIAYLERFLADLSAMDAGAVGPSVLLSAATVLLWLRDGRPGPALLWRGVGRLRRAGR
jgi:hypothetical protein